MGIAEHIDYEIGNTISMVCTVCKQQFDWQVTQPFPPATCFRRECLDAACRRAGLYTGPRRQFDDADRNRILCRKLGIEAEYHNAELADFDLERPNFSPGKSFLLKGMNGRGKTRLGCAMLKHLVHQGATGRFVTANMYLKRVRSSYSKRASESEMDILHEFLKPDVLVLDDLGAEKQGDFGLGEILTLLSERSVRHLTNIVTTNLKLTEIHKAEPRLASRLAAYEDITLTGGDRRAQTAAEEE